MIGTDGRTREVDVIIRVLGIRGFGTNDIYLLRSVQRHVQIGGVTSTAVYLQRHGNIGLTGFGGHEYEFGRYFIGFRGLHQVLCTQCLNRQYMRTIETVGTGGTYLVNGV